MKIPKLYLIKFAQKHGGGADKGYIRSRYRAAKKRRMIGLAGNMSGSS
ncbi:MAG TPA: hypothetical protein VKB53_02505 [Gammaproteobacteria bacterium]|nr:hypothetical protein [Gammaproteobacteria bacterium]